MMAHTALCFRVRFRGQNIQATINLKSIGIDNLGIEFSASSIASAVFPTAVGPTTKKVSFTQ
jgi:hypothetical protein